MNKFEVVLIFNPELSSNALYSELENFKTKIDSHSGKVINEENWGLRDLSYNINKYKKKKKRNPQIEAPGQIINEINKDLNQSENVIRYLFIKVNDHQQLPTKLNYEKKEV
jgi:small subunit ribosomal protein S6